MMLVDDAAADQLARKLLGESLGGWRIESPINHGKSAVVFLAKKNGQVAALKVFDPDIVARYGKDSQLGRIQRELSLIGKSHPNVVQIYDGGEDAGYLFVAMEYFPGSNLAEALPKIPPENVRSLISQLAAGAKFLEDSAFAHRDIKPENIGVSPQMDVAKLLDLGVIRPLDLSNVTDEGEQRLFVGTLQYSPPELLFREEEQSTEAWRAITFYQLGAVLHDLLTRRPLFSEQRYPYARLVRAVERELPHIPAADDDADLRLLAQNCLAKSPTHRLDTVKWNDFSQPKVADPLEAARRRIALHRGRAEGRREDLPADDLAVRHAFSLRTAIESAVVNTIAAESLPRYSTLRVKEPNPFLLRVLFEPSERDGLMCCFTLYCQSAVEQGAAGMADLEIWACVSSTRADAPVEPAAEAPALRIRGSIIEQDIRKHVHQFLMITFSQALDFTPEQCDTVRWLVPGE